MINKEKIGFKTFVKSADKLQMDKKELPVLQKKEFLHFNNHDITNFDLKKNMELAELLNKNPEGLKVEKVLALYDNIKNYFSYENVVDRERERMDIMMVRKKRLDAEDNIRQARKTIKGPFLRAAHPFAKL
ncbi:MAG: hypothetical protein KKA79_05090 [Nanoarchaeota archaeon]|nr:hypothetical protein [Nanoarchaeota archaeon]MCG2718874.1 hypothetical protein [Nanoarchaeota archaeon]